MKFPFNAITMLSLIGIIIVGACYIYKPSEDLLEGIIVLTLMFIISVTVDICNLKECLRGYNESNIISKNKHKIWVICNI